MQIDLTTLRLSTGLGGHRRIDYWRKAVTKNAQAHPHGKAFSTLPSKQVIPIRETTDHVRRRDVAVSHLRWIHKAIEA